VSYQTGMEVQLNCVVVQAMRVSPINLIIRVSPEGWELPEFKPGQFVVLGLPYSSPRCPEAAAESERIVSPDILIRRAYSIASSSRAREYVEFYISLVQSGELTPRIFALRVGDRIWMSRKPTGMFTMDLVPQDSSIALVATGTGVAPYMSMLRSRIIHDQAHRRFAVVHGASNSWDLGYSSELLLLQSMFPNFSYLPTVIFPDREPAPWRGDTRFVQDMWADGVVEKAWGFKPTPENTHIFLCGNPRMIEGMLGALSRDGFVEHTPRNPGQVYIERYD